MVARAQALVAHVWRAELDFCGIYGEPSEEGNAVKVLPIELGDDQRPWLCDTFSAKAFAFLETQCRATRFANNSDVLFWCTKTLVQPGKEEDAFERMQGPQLNYVQESGIRSQRDFHSHPRSVKII